MANLEIIGKLTQSLTTLETGQPIKVDALFHSSIATLIKLKNSIKLVDGSPAGWALVEEYLGSELASDEEDKKKIKKAAAAVEQKYKE